MGSVFEPGGDPELALRSIEKALEAGQWILSSDVNRVLATEVRFDLFDAVIDVGRWDNAKSYREALRYAPQQKLARRCPPGGRRGGGGVSPQRPDRRAHLLGFTLQPAFPALVGKLAVQFFFRVDELTG